MVRRNCFMNKIERLEKFLDGAQKFMEQNITCSDSKFEAWNNSLLRFIDGNYDKATYDIFKNRSYSLSIWTFSTPDSDFVKAFKRDLKTTIEDLKMLLDEEKDEPSFDNNKVSKTLTDNIQLIINLFNRFHLICKQLRERYNSRETLDVCDEYDVQDLIHSLLCIYFDDIRAEEWTPSYAGSCSRQDFLLKKENIVIEIKKTRKGLQDKQVGEQLIVDIERYRSHPDCKILLCFIYDPDERISNPRGLENDLTKVTDGLNVITVVTQK